MSRFKSQVALVMGSTSGISHAALRFVSKGTFVVIDNLLGFAHDFFNADLVRNFVYNCTFERIDNHRYSQLSN